MPSVDHEPGSADSEAKEALAFYKSQIHTLESELADFQSSSRELEQELEKELEASEKQHRDLRNKNEQLRYEVEEWKVRYYPEFTLRAASFADVRGDIRTNTNKPRRKPTLPKTPSKRKLLPSETRTARSRSDCATSKYRTMISNGRSESSSLPWRIWSKSTIRV